MRPSPTYIHCCRHVDVEFLAINGCGWMLGGGLTTLDFLHHSPCELPLTRTLEYPWPMRRDNQPTSTSTSRAMFSTYPRRAQTDCWRSTGETMKTRRIQSGVGLEILRWSVCELDLVKTSRGTHFAAISSWSPREAKSGTGCWSMECGDPIVLGRLWGFVGRAVGWGSVSGLLPDRPYRIRCFGAELDPTWSHN